MNTNRKAFGDSGTTSRAELRGVFGRDFNYFSSSLFRFEAKYIEELKPGYIPHRPIETIPAIPRVHFLNTDGVIPSNQLIGDLKVEIPSLIPYLLMSLSYQYSSFSPSVRAFYPVRQPLLSHSKNFFGLLKEAGVLYLLPIRSSKEGLKPDIYTYHSASLRQWLFWHILAGEAYIPFARRCSTNDYCFYVPVYGAGETELEPAYIFDREIFAI